VKVSFRQEMELTVIEVNDNKKPLVDWLTSFNYPFSFFFLVYDLCTIAHIKFYFSLTTHNGRFGVHIGQPWVGGLETKLSIIGDKVHIGTARTIHRQSTHRHY